MVDKSKRPEIDLRQEYIDEGRCWMLSDRVFENVILSRGLAMMATAEKPRVISNVVYRHCKLKSRFGFIHDHILLENVEFDNLDVPRVDVNPEHVIFRNVVFKGSKLKRLIISPATAGVLNPVPKPWAFSHPGYSLDISEFRGKELEIVGVDISGIKINHERHWKFDTEKLRDVDLSKLGISEDNRINITINSAFHFQARWKVSNIWFHRPGYAEAVQILRDAGLAE